ncbi:myb-like protein I [Ceratitis capitata]|uniref:myb-like protein I n=1 Tax=Ceratitis capitata TaxID=7213 RepID=UPI0003296E6F|nr:myb-like protein I [Ceratitis capitata]
MASDMDKFLEMSLDEYIASKKNSVCSNEKKSVANNIGAGRRNSKTNDLNDEDEVMENEVEALGETSLMNTNDKLNKSFGIWRGPSAETNYIDLDYMKDEFDEMFNDPELKVSHEDKQMKQNRSKDLRERLNRNLNASKNNNTNCSSTNNNVVHDEQTIPTVNRNNWRSNMQTQQNSVSLMSLNTEGGSSGNGQFRRRWNNNNNRNFRRRNTDGCGGNRGSGQQNNGGQKMNWNYNRNNGGSPNGIHNSNALSMNNNGRIQRFNQRNGQDNLNKRIKTVLDQINGTSPVFLNKQPVRDLTIECPSISISGRLASGALQNASKQNLQVPATQTQSDLKSLLGVNENNLKADTMAMWAGKLLELFQSTQQQTVHKPIYDMQIQKEIHELQGKSLLYKCPSGEVVSSDGSGIENCKITPNSSGVTLNYRFG